MTTPLVLDPLPVETPRVLFDISRLLRRRNAAFGTGVDRIDLAIGLDLVARFGARCGFVHAGPLGPALLSADRGAALLGAVAARWQGGDAPIPRALPLLGALALGALRRPDAAERAETTYVVASHSGLALRRGWLERLDPDRRMRRLVYVHDLIPLDFPEYQRPRSAATFRRFLDTLAAGPVRFAANTADTARRLAAHAAAEGWASRGSGPKGSGSGDWPAASIIVAVPRLGPPAPAAAAPRPAVRALLDDARPFLITVGTIEPRKNHLLLLNLWRAMAVGPAAPPRLVIVGRRGWENEMVLDMLDRCPAVRAHVSEFGDLADAEVTALLGRARALLMPSFAEGLGVPVLEAAAVGAPLILSDLPALREIAPPAAVFLDPLDGPAWRRAILDAGR